MLMFNLINANEFVYEKLRVNKHEPFGLKLNLNISKKQWIKHFVVIFYIRLKFTIH
jgi:hypothetical protein